MSSHLTGEKLPEHRLYEPELPMLEAAARSRGAAGRNTLSPDEQAAAINSCDNGLRQADDMIRRIFGSLRAKGYLDDAIVVISSDHGEALGEHGIYAHGSYLYPEFLRIPLFIYDAKRTYPPIAFASQTDIAATVVAPRLGCRSLLPGTGATCTAGSRASPASCRIRAGKSILAVEPSGEPTEVSTICWSVRSIRAACSTSPAIRSEAPT